MKIWFDFTNPPHVNFFNPIIKHFKTKGFEIKCTARDFVETSDLLKLHHIQFDLYGKHGGREAFTKVIALLDRYRQLFLNVKSFDISFSSNNEAPFVSWLKRKPAVVFDDNDTSPNWLYSRFARFVISPIFINKDAMYRMGIKPRKLITYEGFKEDIYIADYKPDPSFMKMIPFKEFITVRPENIQAAYVPKYVKSIVPDLINKLIDKGFNIVFLPRYLTDKNIVQEHDRIFIPEKPLNGLDVCYYSNAVLTGAGSFSREAALIGTPAVSFFAGNNFLGVDKHMFNNGMVYFSRNPDDIVNYILKSRKQVFNNIRSKSVQSEFLNVLEKIIIQ